MPEPAFMGKLNVGFSAALKKKKKKSVRVMLQRVLSRCNALYDSALQHFFFFVAAAIKLC